ncbi:hypothetical protein B296_00045302 [Ensete ventricosum]|uniref:Uncharacterized protein n=1 Tax=Ensete ventricosum TaxID=4639 RepID=A0A426XW56_ENSVE|nr:hypothetical protein B296_00045302 [Ensete ventricosum]
MVRTERPRARLKARLEMVGTESPRTRLKARLEMVGTESPRARLKARFEMVGTESPWARLKAPLEMVGTKSPRVRLKACFEIVGTESHRARLKARLDMVGTESPRARLKARFEMIGASCNLASSEEIFLGIDDDSFVGSHHLIVKGLGLWPTLGPQMPWAVKDMNEAWLAEAGLSPAPRGISGSVTPSAIGVSASVVATSSTAEKRLGVDEGSSLRKRSSRGLHFVSTLIDRVHDAGRLVRTRHERILARRATNKKLKLGVNQDLVTVVEFRMKGLEEDVKKLQAELESLKN